MFDVGYCVIDGSVWRERVDWWWGYLSLVGGVEGGGLGWFGGEMKTHCV